MCLLSWYIKNNKENSVIAKGVKEAQSNAALNFCIAVREPGSGVWEVGNHGTGGAPQVLRRHGQTEAEAAVLHPSERVGVGG